MVSTSERLVHVICHKENGKFKGLVTLDPKTMTFESHAWRIPKDQAPRLIGAMFCMHARKAAPSEYGGRIISIKYVPQPSANKVEMAVVEFEAASEAKGLRWPPTYNPNEFLAVVL